MDKAFDDKNKVQTDVEQPINDADFEGRKQFEVDIDRMINEGLGGGYVSDQNGHIGETSVDFM